MEQDDEPLGGAAFNPMSRNAVRKIGKVIYDFKPRSLFQASAKVHGRIVSRLDLIRKTLTIGLTGDPAVQIWNDNAL
jgi:hypothetical protein